MTYTIPDAVFSARIHPTAKLLWAYLNIPLNQDASIAEIATDMNLSERIVQERRAELENAGLLVVHAISGRRNVFETLQKPKHG